MILLTLLQTRLLPIFFFFNDTATTEIYTLSLHDALPIFHHAPAVDHSEPCADRVCVLDYQGGPNRSMVPSSSPSDRKSTRLNSSHLGISYAVFCLKKKNLNLPTAYNKSIL